MRRTTAALVLCLSLLATACTGATSADDSDGGLIEARSVDLPEAAPANPVLGTTPEGLWVAGGVTGGPGTWQPNRLAVLYGAEGQPERSVELPLPDGHQLAGGSVVDVAGATLLVGSTCPVPGGTEPACAPPVDPVAYRFDDGTAVDLDLARGLEGTALDLAPGTVVAAGATDGRAVVVLGQTSDPQDRTGQVVGALLDPATGAVDDAGLPDGVLSPSSVCATDDDVYSVVAVGTGQVDAVEVHAASVGGAVPVAGLAALAGSHPSGGTLLCAGGVLGLHLRSAPGELAVIDVDGGEVVDGPVEVPTTLAAALTATDGGSAVVTARRSPDGGDVVGFTDEVTEVHELGPDGVRAVGEITDAAASRHVGVVFDGVAFDVQPALRDPHGAFFPQL